MESKYNMKRWQNIAKKTLWTVAVHETVKFSSSGLCEQWADASLDLDLDDGQSKAGSKHSRFDSMEWQLRSSIVDCYDHGLMGEMGVQIMGAWLLNMETWLGLFLKTLRSWYQEVKTTP